jgi:GT2 family glycosyltransferase
MTAAGGRPRPRVSVLLPCRDAAAHLPDAIASLAAQTFSDFEVLAVDDGSTDDTPRLLHDWSARDRTVRVLSSGGAGLVAALDLAAGHARGRVLARMDADDIAHPLRFELQLRLMDADPGLAGCGTRVRYFPRDLVRDGARRYERWVNSLVDAEDIARDVFVECPIPHPTLMVLRDAFEAVGGYRDTGWPEDHDLVLALWAAGCRLGKAPEVLLEWRERPDRASRTDPRYSPDAFRRCRVHWLTRTVLRADWPETWRRGGGAAALERPRREPVPQRASARLRPVVVWGAGPVGKGLSLELQRQGADVAAFVDLDPRKIGQRIHGAPVIAPGDIGRHAGAFAVAAVGDAAARGQIRAALAEAGWVEMRDFCAVA